ncbi:MAG TPA: hypothetical protein VFV95_16810 [Vicinamibacterales bacterium]|nr:hypothetical protein [Vicinamibacterales bacterium]
MKLTSRVQRDVGTVVIAISLVAAASFAAAGRSAAADPPPGQAAAPTTPPGSAAEADGVQEMKKRLEGYLKMRSDLTHKLKPLSSTADAAELTARQDSLASAIKIARKDARKGDLIPMAAAARIRTIVADDFKSRAPDARRAAFGEVPEGVVVAVNRTYPAQAALPTVPPLLLNKLPALPDNLQYVFVGRHVVLLDGDTQLIVDYVDNVLPPR